MVALYSYYFQISWSVSENSVQVHSGGSRISDRGALTYYVAKVLPKMREIESGGGAHP